MTRVAAVDCGTNSLRLLVADLDDGALADVHREMRVVRLGQGVDRTGWLTPGALERTRRALADYAVTIRDLGAEQVRMVATSATRDARNSAQFVSLVRGELGVVPEVITGHQEAALSFAGAASVRGAAGGPMLVADIGGGSTELVRGGDPDGVLRSYSIDVGCVRMTERHLHDDPPTPAQVEDTLADLRAAIGVARAHVPLDAAIPMVAVAGTATTIAAIALGLPRYDAQAIHASIVSAEQVDEVAGRLLAMTHHERAELPVMHPGRVDVIAGGALVLRTLVEQIGVREVIVSEHDILDGIVLSLGR